MRRRDLTVSVNIIGKLFWVKVHGDYKMLPGMYKEVWYHIFRKEGAEQTPRGHSRNT